MSHDSRRGYQVYYSLLGLILSLAVILWVNEYYVLNVNIFICILYAIIPAVSIYVFDRYKKNTVSYLVLLSLLPVLLVIFLISKTDPISWLGDIIDWVIRYDRTEKLYEAMGAYSALAAVALGVSIILYIFIKKTMTRLLLGAAIITIFITFSVLRMPIGKAAVGIGIFYIANNFIELTGMLYGSKSGHKEKKESILFLIPMCILLALISIGLPSKAEPIQWTGVKNLYYSIKDYINNLTTEWEFFIGKGSGVFSISLSGYSDDGSLDNDDLVENNKVALVVESRRGLSPMYLTGSVNETYTGFSWEKNDEGYLKNEQEYQMDYAELLYALSRLDPEVFEEHRLIESNMMNIIYNNIKTKTFFYPSKTRWLKFEKDGQSLNFEPAGITFLKAKGNKTKYNITYYEINLQGQAIQDMLRQSDDFSYDYDRPIDHDRIEWVQGAYFVRDRENFILNRDDFYELYKERAELIHNTYTQLPDSLPDRVKELAYEITKDQEKRFDKLKAIEAYLLEYEYSYSPGKKPEDADFVDYFLFDNRKGYCTSFATAMAVLGRCIGIPTRYVEGYLVDYTDKDDRGFLVRNSNAHAWVEAYFEGVGWIPFEATPPFYEERYTEWAPIRKYQETNTDRYYNIPTIIPPMEEMASSPITPVVKNNKNGVFIWLLVIIIMIIALVLALITYYLILRHKYKKEFDSSDYDGKMYKVFLRILTLLRYEGFTLEAQDTLLMMSDRIKDRYQYEDIIFRDVVNIFMDYRYGEVPVTDKKFTRVNTFYEGLRRAHENETKTLKLHLEEFIFLIKAFSHSANS